MNEDKRNERILEALGDTIVELSSKEVCEIASDAGIDLKKSGTAMRNAMLAAVDEFDANRMSELRQQREARVAGLESSSSVLPLGPDLQRAALAHLLASRPDVASSLTAQFRNAASLSDEDVANILSQLIELGVIEKDELDR